MNNSYLKSLLLVLISLCAISGFAQNEMIKAKQNKEQKTKGLRKKGNQHHKAVNATLVCSNTYTAGATSALNFRLRLINTDFEYGDSISITFPNGASPISTPNDPIFTSLDTDAIPETLNGINGQTITWGDNDNVYGGLESEVNIDFSINVSVANGISGVLTGNFFISGDQFGDDPSDFSGNFKISNIPPKPDLMAIALVPGNYFSTPLKQINNSKLSAIVKNNGGNFTPPLNTNFSVSPGSFNEQVVLNRPLAMDSSVTLQTQAGFIPNAVGKYTATFNATFGGDENNADNLSTAAFEVSSNFFSYNNFDVNNAMPLSVGGVGFLANVVRLNVKDTLKKVEVFLASPQLNGQLNVAIYNYNPANLTLGSKIASSTVFNVGSEDPQLHDFPFDNLVLNPGAYLVAVEELTEESSSGLGSSFDNYNPGTHFVNFGDGVIEDIGDFGGNFERTFMLRPYFTEAGPLGINALLAKQLNIYPNPSNGILQIDGIVSGKITIIDQLGKTVLDTELTPTNRSLNISKLEAGSYLLSISNETGYATKLISLVK